MLRSEKYSQFCSDRNRFVYKFLIKKKNFSFSPSLKATFQFSIPHFSTSFLFSDNSPFTFISIAIEDWMDTPTVRGDATQALKMARIPTFNCKFVASNETKTKFLAHFHQNSSLLKISIAILYCISMFTF